MKLNVWNILSGLACIFGALAIVGPSAGAGTVSGKIVFEGDAPPMKEIDMGVDPVCEHGHDTPIRAEVLVLGEGQTMANVFVHIVEGLPKKKYPMPEKPALLNQKGCVYSPHVLAVRAGQPITVLNPDDTLHNVHGMPKVNREFNKTMIKRIKEMVIVFEKAESMFRIKCDVHPWMTSYCVVVDHPFFDVTEKDGVYQIDGLDPGEYVIEARHERLGSRRATITISDDTAAVADFSFARP